MDSELRRYSNVVVILLSLNAGFLATLVWVSGEAVPLGFVVVSAVIGGGVFGGIAWMLATVLDQ